MAITKGTFISHISSHLISSDLISSVKRPIRRAGDQSDKT